LSCGGGVVQGLDKMENIKRRRKKKELVLILALVDNRQRIGKLVKSEMNSSVVFK